MNESKSLVSGKPYVMTSAELATTLEVKHEKAIYRVNVLLQKRKYEGTDEIFRTWYVDGHNKLQPCWALGLNAYEDILFDINCPKADEYRRQMLAVAKQNWDEKISSEKISSEKISSEKISSERSSSLVESQSQIDVEKIPESPVERLGLLKELKTVAEYFGIQKDDPRLLDMVGEILDVGNEPTVSHRRRRIRKRKEVTH